MEAKKSRPEYKDFQKGDIAVRKGRLCVISKINWDTNPPDVTVRMQDTNDEVGTEFSRLSRPTDEDMLKYPMSKKKESNNNKLHSSASNASNPKKRSFFDAFFDERKQRFNKNTSSSSTATNRIINGTNAASVNRKKRKLCDDMPRIASSNSSYSDRRTFDDLLIDGPSQKRRKLSNKCDIAQGWFCSACTVENPDMDTMKCFLCETPRTYEEKIKYPTLNPVILPSDEANDTNNTNHIDKKVDDVENKEKQRSLTYITWNVWFEESVQVIERMKAIGNIIKKHNADIVCFQEITPTILDILESGDWYQRGGYSSTILPSFGQFNGLSYFNVIVTRHEFVRDSIQFKYFSNTQMGRHLIVAPIKLTNSGNRVVYAATSHLESPVGPWMGGRKDMFSPQRKEQLTNSLQILDDKQICENNDVIFGGDFNWCRATKKKENDGDLNKLLRGSWTDCYHALHPNEKGYTYDAKNNGMLLGYLQNRLDRIVYKNNSKLQLKSCEMIGREVIPNVTYIKTVKRKGAREDKVLPVFPSDHFGLIARFDLV